MRWATLAFILIAGCGGGSADDPPPYDAASDNHGYGYEFDVQGVNGLRVRYSPYLTDNGKNIFTDPARYEKEFAEVLACSGLSAPMPPYLILMDALAGVLGHDKDGNLVRGVMLSNPTVIVADFRSVFLDAQLVKHEYLHYVLLQATGDPDSNHVSPFFTQCTNG